MHQWTGCCADGRVVVLPVTWRGITPPYDEDAICGEHVYRPLHVCVYHGADVNEHHINGTGTPPSSSGMSSRRALVANTHSFATLSLSRLKPVIDRCYGLDQIADAHRYQSKPTHT